MSPILRPSAPHRLSIAAALIAASALGVAATPSRADAQWSTTYEQFYMPGSFNWTFRNEYPAADRLFNAFDYGHAILYERLYTSPGADPSVLEDREFDFITRKLLVSPPNVPLEEAAIEVAYAKMAPEAKAMFDWAHLLHRQLYDVLADERLSRADKDATIRKLVAYYKTRPDLAFSSAPKTMELMEGQPYSLAFRRKYPKFNGLIWSYHWLQVGLYEPLVVGTTLAERQAGVAGAVARFRQMLENAPEFMPRVMPMTAAVAPTFAARYPEAAIIFDNLHSMHDVVSDILANPSVPRGRKRAEILRAASHYRDRTSYVMTEQEWKEMAQMVGLENMGGPAVGFLPDLPTPTVERGATMVEAMRHTTAAGGGGYGAMRTAGDSATGAGAMPGMHHGAAGHDTMPGTSGTTGADSAARGATEHPAMGGTAADSMMSGMMEMHGRMMADPVIRGRVMGDSALRRMMTETMGRMPAHHRATMQRTMADPTRGRATGRGAPRRAAPAAPKRKPPAPATDSMPGMDHGAMKGMSKP